MIRVNNPWIPAAVTKELQRVVQKGMLSGTTPIIELFEQKVAQQISVRHGIAVSSGTAALHIAMASMGLQPGDEVIIPDLTIISCAAAVRYCGATPVICSVDEFGNLDPKVVNRALSKRTKAVLVVHHHGFPAQIDHLRQITRQNKLVLIEDCAQAMGVEVAGKPLGSWGDLAIFSFYANKLITTGEGGMVVTQSGALAERARQLRNLSHHPQQRFYHEEIGFNYRMSSLQAACGIGMFSNLGSLIKRRRALFADYSRRLPKHSNIQYPWLDWWKKDAKALPWVCSLVLDSAFPMTRDQLQTSLLLEGIESRRYFYPLRLQPALKGLIRVVGKSKNADRLSQNGLYLPSGTNTSAQERLKVTTVLQKIFQSIENNSASEDS